MTPFAILSLIVIYFGILFVISHIVSKKDNGNDAFFKANKNSKWYLVAFGMIGTALSGVTFISVPGEVGNPDLQFKYFQFVLGNAIGFIIIAKVLLPLYYRMNLTSIYGYIEQRLGVVSYKTAATIFLISRTIGSSFRLYLVVIVLQRYVFDYYGIPFTFTVLISLLLIFAYTYRGGLKTIIITDTLQTFFLVLSVFLTIFFICRSLDLSFFTAFEEVKNSHYSKIFFFDDYNKGNYFWKQILGGIFVTIAMVGLDQDLMQKNLSCKNIEEAQKNMFTFTGIFVIINIFFLSVGALLYMFAEKNAIQVPMVDGIARTDFLFPEIALKSLGLIPAVVFLLGLTAATFATTDSALTALTTSFCVDFLGMDKTENLNKPNIVRTRHLVHIGFSGLMFLVIVIFNSVNDASVVKMIFKIASYTYGPLLGLYSFGLFVKSKTVHDKLVPFICLISPAICFLISIYSKELLGDYVFDNELIIVNGLITFVGLLLISKPATKETRF
ncbi:sodium:solute symporter [Flavobacterium psychrophilum]|jgi:Na+/proline symporter|uniref:sodium:solute symporter n=1 Tax=Flavobacterium psychrophilum TaxID=96345 RepID=UPI0004F88393|nr:sodium:solute symporter [Flavobacterium psychrophilum]AIN73453.1 sodium:solute symporter [Flavobacterium psychrophilum FPG3]EKT2069361.1 sodium:solute symporter [Flavobacterium psychrophilum]EKT2071625.1 sodium:solute symporter [Flavobacterium psychrophilum]EKT3965353.1 sodium:solute symporter [Flavobacterium psychrophilum]EKT4491146.1 sodium:solute symporter [Flavobacterium psychrophilum]